MIGRNTYWLSHDLQNVCETAVRHTQACSHSHTRSVCTTKPMAITAVLSVVLILGSSEEHVQGNDFLHG